MNPWRVSRTSVRSVSALETHSFATLRVEPESPALQRLNSFTATHSHLLLQNVVAQAELLMGGFTV
jgi:hypothetical protein